MSKSKVIEERNPPALPDTVHRLYLREGFEVSVNYYEQQVEPGYTTVVLFGGKGGINGTVALDPEKIPELIEMLQEVYSAEVEKEVKRYGH
jgi:hypothetical protein